MFCKKAFFLARQLQSISAGRVLSRVVSRSINSICTVEYFAKRNYITYIPIKMEEDQVDDVNNFKKRKRVVKEKPNKEAKVEPLRYQPTGRDDWRKWLEDNHDKIPCVWVVYFKKAAKRTDTVNYAEMVEEALCMGWIDSTAKSIDNQRSSLRFTPRKDVSNWSEVNKKRAKQLIKSGKMTELGLAKMTDAVRKEVEADAK
jgi:uncharacterized protein YdeI (YjbR/CyaY-like superfamily)